MVRRDACRIRHALIAWFLSSLASVSGASATELQNAAAEAAAIPEMAPVLAFVKNGGDPNALTDDDRTLLHVAINWNFREYVKALLDRGADPNRCGPSGSCPLVMAAGRDTEILRMLVAADAGVNHRTEKFGYTALGHAAALRRDTFERITRTGGYRGPFPNAIESVRILIAAGANVNSSDNFGASPLRIAIHKRNLKISELLLRAGADPHQRGDPMRAAQEGDTILMQAIGDYSLYKDIAPIRLLLDHGADPNDRNKEPYNELCEEHGGCYWRGYSALGYSARHGRLSVVRLLLERGADPKIGRNDGRTAYELAAAFAHPQTAALLKQHLKQDSHPPPSRP